jgi:hypothetical protein
VTAAGAVVGVPALGVAAAPAAAAAAGVEFAAAGVAGTAVFDPALLVAGAWGASAPVVLDAGTVLTSGAAATGVDAGSGFDASGVIGMQPCSDASTSKPIGSMHCMTACR